MSFRLVYEDKESKEYTRSLVTTTIMNANTLNDLVLDFYEEYVKPRMPIEFTKDSSTYSHENDEMIIIREKKTTVVMSKDTALKMANWIINHYKEEGDPT